MFVINYNSNLSEPHSFSNFQQLQEFCLKNYNFLNFELFHQDFGIKSENDFQMLNDILELSLEPLELILKPKFTQDNANLVSPSNIHHFYCSANLQISKWKVIKKLGVGAFGQVYLTYSENECYAVKTSRHEKSDSVKQIQNEVELLKSISHPNVIQYVAFEYDKYSGTAFMAMEYLPKGSLHDEIKRTGPLTLESARSYGKQILAALIYIHSKNIIHRDIKCGNWKRLSKNKLKTKILENIAYDVLLFFWFDRRKSKYCRPSL